MIDIDFLIDKASKLDEDNYRLFAKKYIHDKIKEMAGDDKERYKNLMTRQFGIENKLRNHTTHEKRLELLQQMFYTQFGEFNKTLQHYFGDKK